MQFKNVHVKDFRGISSLELEDIGSVNLLVGQNNSGKTSVLEALFLLTGISNPQLTININRFRDFVREVDENNIRLVFKNLDFNKPIQLSAEFDQDSYKRTLTIRPHVKEERANDSKKIINLEGIDSNLSVFQQPIIDGISVSFTIKKKHKQREVYSSVLLFVPGGGEVYPPANYKERFNAVFLGPGTIYQGLDVRIDKLLVEKQEEKLIAILQKIDSNIQGISLGVNGIIYFDIGLDRLVPINIMGDGVRRMLSIIVTIADVKNGIIFIDEIDNGFHYSVLKMMWNAIMETSHQYSVQVFATSHSEECIKALTASYYSTSPLFNDTDIRLFRIEKHDKKHRAVAYDHEVLETSLELNLGIR